MSELSDYIRDRVDDQIVWHSSKSREYKRKTNFTQTIIIVVSSIVPVINIIDFLPLSTRLISAILASIITMTTLISQQRKYEELWQNYRRTVEELKRERYLVTTRSGQYNGSDEESRKRMFVERIEFLLSSEYDTNLKKEHVKENQGRS